MSSSEPYYLGEIQWIDRPPQDPRLAEKLVRENKVFQWHDDQNQPVILYPYEIWYERVTRPVTTYFQSGGQNFQSTEDEEYEEKVYRNLYDNNDVFEPTGANVSRDNAFIEKHCDNAYNRISQCQLAMQQAAFNQNQHRPWQAKSVIKQYQPRAPVEKKSRWNPFNW